MSVVLAPVAHANPSAGDQCNQSTWHSTTVDSNGQTLVCTHTPDSGHGMFWETTIQDRSYRASGFKTDHPPYPHNPGGPPCSSSQGIVIKVNPETHNAIEDFGPPGCDLSKPMVN